MNIDKKLNSYSERLHREDEIKDKIMVLLLSVRFK